MTDSPCDLDDLMRRGYRFALSLTHDASSAEDLLQDAWFALLRANGSWTPGYLLATIRNRFVDKCRRAGRAVMEPLDDSLDEDPSDDPGSWSGATDSVIENGTLERLLGRLRPEDRAVLYLSAVEDFTAQQIAEFLDWPRGTVLSMIHRSREKLRRWLPSERGPGK